jgi:hypothetical protein
VVFKDANIACNEVQNQYDDESEHGVNAEKQELWEKKIARESFFDVYYVADFYYKAHDDFLGGWTVFELEWQSLKPAALERVARALIERKVVLVPTLALHEAFSRLADSDLRLDPALVDVPADVLSRSWDPADIMARAHWTPQVLAAFKRTLPVLQRFVKSYRQLGGRIVAGTDAPQQFVVPGSSLHRELELYAVAGA